MPVIEPIKGSSSLFGKGNRDFNRISARVVSWTSTVDQMTGEKGSFDLGEYPYDRFPDSGQNWRPMYDTKLRQFDIRHEDGKLWTQEDAETLLKKNPLNYPNDWHNPRDQGNPITRINIRDEDDPYFNHDFWVTLGNEGRVETDNDYIGMIKFAMYAGNGGVQQDTGNDYRPGDVRWKIKNPEMEARREEAKLNEYMDNHALFTAMQDDGQRMRNVLIMLGVVLEKDASLTKLRKALIPFIQDNKTESGEALSKKFNRYASVAPKELEKLATIKLATAKAVIREGAGVYKYRDTVVGRSFDEVVGYFSDRTNEDSYDLLVKDLDDLS